MVFKEHGLNRPEKSINNYQARVNGRDALLLTWAGLTGAGAAGRTRLIRREVAPVGLG